MIRAQVTATQITPVFLGGPTVRAMIGTLPGRVHVVVTHAPSLPVGRSLNGCNAIEPPSCKNRRMDEDEQRIRDHLVVVDAFVQAMDRRHEVLQVIDDSEDVDEAIRRVGQLLGVDEFGSRVILDLQFRRLTRDQRQALAAEAEKLRSQLPNGR